MGYDEMKKLRKEEDRIIEEKFEREGKRGEVEGPLLWRWRRLRG